MDIYVGKVIGPWIINKIIFKNDPKWIVKVKLNNDKKNKILKSVLNNIPFWVMKITDDMNEFNKFKNYGLNTSEFGFIIPNDNYYSNGKFCYGKYIFMWFVMEEYCFDCSSIEYINLHLNEAKMLESIVLFLKYIHRGHNIVHNDLKLKNILYKNNEYRVCDYESLHKPENKQLCDETHFNNYYYYYYGCEYKKPIYSYRYDLQALGYILWTIYNNYEKFEFQNVAINYYQKQERCNKYDELEILRKSMIMPDKIKKYFNIISKVDWYCLDPPSEDIYREILNLYKEKDEI